MDLIYARTTHNTSNIKENVENVSYDPFKGPFTPRMKTIDLNTTTTRTAPYWKNSDISIFCFAAIYLVRFHSFRSTGSSLFLSIASE